MTSWAELAKSAIPATGDSVIAHTPSSRSPIYANRGADHGAYSNWTRADHIAAANVHANKAKELNVAAARQGGSMTLKRQASQHLHFASTHRDVGTGSSPPGQRLTASYAGAIASMRKSDRIGVTRSGKTILSAHAGANSRILHGGQEAHVVHPSFSQMDHLEAAEHHAAEAGRTPDRALRSASHTLSQAHSVAAMMHGPTMSGRKSMRAQMEYNDAFRKSGGGPGSRGGEVVGKTASGKPIYAHHGAGHQGYSKFSAADHFQAAKAHHEKGQSLIEAAHNNDHDEPHSKRDFADIDQGHLHHAIARAHHAVAWRAKKEEAVKMQGIRNREANEQRAASGRL